QIAHARGFDPPPFDEFWSRGQYEFPLEGDAELPFASFIAHPANMPLSTPSGNIEIFCCQIEAMNYADCPPHPSWLEPAERLGCSTVEDFPIHLLTNQPASRLHSQLDPGRLSASSKGGTRERIELNAADASERDIRDGDTVRVFNQRGAFLASA